MELPPPEVSVAGDGVQSGAARTDGEEVGGAHCAERAVEQLGWQLEQRQRTLRFMAPHRERGTFPQYLRGCHGADSFAAPVYLRTRYA